MGHECASRAWRRAPDTAIAGPSTSPDLSNGTFTGMAQCWATMCGSRGLRCSPARSTGTQHNETAGAAQTGSCFQTFGDLGDGDALKPAVSSGRSRSARPRRRSQKSGSRPIPKVDPQEAKNGAGNRRPDNTEHDIHHHSHATLHELLCKPACNPADDDGCDPANCWVSHSSSPYLSLIHI